MDICTEHDQDIVYDDYCPACELKNEVEELREKVSDLEAKLEQFQEHEDQYRVGA